MRKLKKVIPAALMLALYFICLWLSFTHIHQAELLYPGWSLRYGEGISAQNAMNAKRYAAENDKNLWFAFWKETTADTRSEAGGIGDVPVVLYGGEPAYAKPVTFIAGAYPGELSSTNCIISELLAWQLWGSLDTLGKTVEFDGKEKIVAGIYKSSRAEAAYSSENSNEIWQNVEVYGPDGTITREDLTDYITAAGLGQPSAIIDGKGIIGLLSAALWLPPVILAGAGVLFLLRILKAERLWLRNAVIFTGLLLLAAFLPRLLGLLPPWLIPTKWSDFSFWTGLWEKFGGYIAEFLGMRPYTRDIQVKTLLIKQAAVLSLSFLYLPFFIGKMRPKELVYNTQSRKEDGQEAKRPLHFSEN